MFVVLEGLDGAGKSTQVKMLREYLEGLCPGLEYIHFPRYDAPVYGDLIAKFLRGGFGNIDEVHPQLVALLFAEDRRDAAPYIRKVLDGGGSVLLDRYVYSNVAYQCAKLASDEEAAELMDWILRTEYGDFALPRPDLNIFLNVPMSFIESSLRNGREGSDRDYLRGAADIHEADIRFQKRVRDLYLKLAEKDPALKVVDCSDENGNMLPPEAIFSRIKTVCDENR